MLVGAGLIALVCIPWWAIISNAGQSTVSLTTKETPVVSGNVTPPINTYISFQSSEINISIKENSEENSDPDQIEQDDIALELEANFLAFW